MAQKLREAGAVIFGKTNLSEWANIRSSHSVSGWSGRGGLEQKSLRAGSESLRVEFRLGGGGSGQSVRGGGGYGNRWFGGLPVVGQRNRGPQADLGHDQSAALFLSLTVRIRPDPWRERSAMLRLAQCLAGADPRDKHRRRQGKDRGRLHELSGSGLRGARIGVARKYLASAICR